MNAAVEAINFALTLDSPREFLACWREGDWATLRNEWPEAPATVAAPTQAEPSTGYWIAADDVRRLTRELDVALNGVEGAAPQAALCDIAAQCARWVSENGRPILAVARQAKPIDVMFPNVDGKCNCALYPDRAALKSAPQAQPSETAIAEVVQAAFSHCDSNGLVIEPDVVDDLVRFTIAALKSAQFSAPAPGTVRFDIPAKDCLEWESGSYPMVTCRDCKASDYGIDRLTHRAGCRVASVLESGPPQPSAQAQAESGEAPALELQTRHWTTLGGFFQRFNGDDHACIPVPAWRALMTVWRAVAAQAQAAPEAAAVLNEVRWWDHRGDTVEEHYDEIHGAGAFERVVASAPQPSAAAREPLTPDQLDELILQHEGGEWVTGATREDKADFARTIERAHGIAAQAAAKGEA